MKYFFLLILFSIPALAENSINNKGLVCLGDHLPVVLRIWCENNKCFQPRDNDYKINWNKEVDFRFISSDKIEFEINMSWHVLDRENLMLYEQISRNPYRCELKKTKNEVAADLLNDIKERKKKNKF